METNLVDTIKKWLNGTASPKIETVIGVEDATLNKTALYLLGITAFLLGGLKIILNSSLAKHARHMGANF